MNEQGKVTKEEVAAANARVRMGSTDDHQARQDILTLMAGAVQGIPEATASIPYILPYIQQYGLDADRSKPGVQFGVGGQYQDVPGTGLPSADSGMTEFNRDQQRQTGAMNPQVVSMINRSNQERENRKLAGTVDTGRDIQGPGIDPGTAERVPVGSSVIQGPTPGGQPIGAAGSGGDGAGGMYDLPGMGSSAGKFYEGITRPGAEALMNDPDEFVSQYLDSIGANGWGFQGRMSQQAAGANALYGLFNGPGRPGGAPSGDAYSMLDWQEKQLSGGMDGGGEVFNPNAAWSEIFSDQAANNPAINGSYVPGQSKESADQQYAIVSSLVGAIGAMGVNPAYAQSMQATVDKAYRDWKSQSMYDMNAGSFIDYMKANGIDKLFD
jgi:hypothetical protein